MTRRLVRVSSMMSAAIVLAPVTHAMPSEGTEVLRAQLEVSVCDIRGAGTSDPVSARLTERQENVTWLGGPAAHFGRGERDQFDLLLDDVRTLSDISDLVLEKPGSDDLCIAQLRLVVNERTIFLRTFSGGVWLNSSSHNMLRTSGTDLRSNASWQDYGWSLPEWIAQTGATMTREALIDHLTSAVSTAMANLGFAWKDAPEGKIVVQRSDEVTVHASTVLKRDGPAWLATDVALAFDLHLCTNARAEPALVNVVTNQATPWYAAVYSDARRDRDRRALAALRDRLQELRPIVLAGDVCPHADPGVNLSYE